MNDGEEPRIHNGFIVVAGIIVLVVAAMVYVKYSEPITPVTPEPAPVIQSKPIDTEPVPRIYEHDVKG